MLKYNIINYTGHTKSINLYDWLKYDSNNIPSFNQKGCLPIQVPIFDGIFKNNKKQNVHSNSFFQLIIFA